MKLIKLSTILKSNCKNTVQEFHKMLKIKLTVTSLPWMKHLPQRMLLKSKMLSKDWRTLLWKLVKLSTQIKMEALKENQHQRSQSKKKLQKLKKRKMKRRKKTRKKKRNEFDESQIIGYFLMDFLKSSILFKTWGLFLSKNWIE